MLKKLAFCCLVLAASATSAQNRLLGEIDLKANSKIERDAGVWVDGQYVGFVDDLQGNDRLVLVPGQHELLFRLVGYEDVRATITVEPDQRAEYRLSMQLRPGVTFPEEDSTARLRIEVEPEEAAIFVNQTFVGHVDRFNGRRGMRIAPGTYRVTVALPGYEAFQTEISLRAGQTYEIETDLRRGRLSEQAAELIATNPGVVSND
jgi:hypothetical protein